MTVSKRLRLEVLRRDGYKCHYCHTADAPLTVDHVIPRALGGPDIAENLVACCQDCNLGKTSINPDEPLVADVSQQAEAFRKAMEAAKRDVMADIAKETKYVHTVQRLWENCTSLDDEYCLPLPDTWPSSARYWAQIGAPEELIEYAFLVTKERYDNHRIPARNAFAYASGIIGNLMEEAARIAQKRSE